MILLYIYSSYPLLIVFLNLKPQPHEISPKRKKLKYGKCSKRKSSDNNILRFEIPMDSRIGSRDSDSGCISSSNEQDPLVSPIKSFKKSDFSNSPKPSGNVKKILQTLKLNVIDSNSASQINLDNSNIDRIPFTPTQGKHIIFYDSDDSVTPKKLTLKDSPAKENPPKNSSPKQTPSKEIPPMHTSPKETSFKDDSFKETPSIASIKFKSPLSLPKPENPFNISSDSLTPSKVPTLNITERKDTFSPSVIENNVLTRDFLMDRRYKAKRDSIINSTPKYTGLIVGRLKTKDSRPNPKSFLESKTPTKIDVPTNRRASMNNYSSNVTERYFNSNKKENNSFTKTPRLGSTNALFSPPSHNFKFPLQILSFDNEFFWPNSSKNQKLFVNISISRRSIIFEGMHNGSKEIPLYCIKNICYSKRGNNCLIGIDVYPNDVSPNSTNIDRSNSLSDNALSLIKLKLDCTDERARDRIEVGTVKQAFSKLVYDTLAINILTTTEHDEMLDFLNQELKSSVSLLSDSDTDDGSNTEIPGESSKDSLNENSNHPLSHTKTGLAFLDSKRNGVLKINSKDPISSPRNERVLRTSARQQNKKKGLESNSVLFVYPFDSKNSITVTVNDFNRLGANEFLNDTIIDFYLKFLLENLKSQKPDLFDQVFVYSSFFYELYNKNPKLEPLKRYQYVKKWTSRVNMSDKKYLFFPINKNQHWFLAVVINPLLSVPESKNSSAEMPSTPSLKQDSELYSSSEAEANIDTRKDDSFPKSSKADSSDDSSQNGEAKKNFVCIDPSPTNPKKESILGTIDSSEINGPIRSQKMEFESKIKEDGCEVLSESDDDVVSLSQLTQLTNTENPNRNELDQKEEEDGSPTCLVENNSSLYDSDEVKSKEMDLVNEPHEIHSDNSQDENSFNEKETGESKPTQVNDGAGIDNSSELSFLSEDGVSVLIEQSPKQLGAVDLNSYGVADDNMKNDSTQNKESDKPKKTDEFDIDYFSTESSPRNSSMINRGARGRGSKKKRAPPKPKQVSYIDPDSKSWILIFDSLGGKHGSVIDNLMSYINFVNMDVYGTNSNVSIQGRYAKAPIQPNFCDCGLYVLQYVEEFLEDPVKISSAVVNRENAQNWFHTNTVLRKRSDISNLIKNLHVSYEKIISQEKSTKEEPPE
ncbi:Ubiquitin-like-specific protease 2 [Smittium mucronatum]|uniref:Ubiquitin-like-specific protease 2 n=1 Tax=Smittium mucronatum TaxID=133383 RepID=A0A1R0H1K5_9FUNG|nr:Ubiquitin-like-specific protease 2 [Smittium mucronatum]